MKKIISIFFGFSIIFAFNAFKLCIAKPLDVINESKYKMRFYFVGNDGLNINLSQFVVDPGHHQIVQINCKEDFCLDIARAGILTVIGQKITESGGFDFQGQLRPNDISKISKFKCFPENKGFYCYYFNPNLHTQGYNFEINQDYIRISNK